MRLKLSELRFEQQIHEPPPGSFEVRPCRLRLSISVLEMIKAGVLMSVGISTSNSYLSSIFATFRVIRFPAAASILMNESVLF